MKQVAGIILAAGLSSRMGAQNKLITEWQGKPLVRHVVDAALASKLSPVVVVTGHEADAVEAALPANIALTRNGDYANGMAGSLLAGIYRIQGLAPMMILLGDMPVVQTADIDSLIAAYKSAGSKSAIVVATSDGDFGNPVIFGPDWFVPLKLLEGDRGARELIEANPDDVITVEIGEAARRDFDVPEAFSAS